MAENDVIASVAETETEQKIPNVKQSVELALNAPSLALEDQRDVATSLTTAPTDSQPAALVTERMPKKQAKRYEQFGETIRYLTWDEWHQLLDSIDDYRHKLMIRLIYHLGCRVGEFVRIQLKHLDFGRSSVFFPAEHTKTRHSRTSHVPRGLMNELKSMLKREERMLKRTDDVKNQDEYLFRRSGRSGTHYSENRIRQIFQNYAKNAGFNRVYGEDSRGRKLRQFTVHSLRHSHVMHAVHIHKLPLPIVQKQVGHRTLKATSVYLNPSDEAVGEAYEGIEHG